MKTPEDKKGLEVTPEELEEALAIFKELDDKHRLYFHEMIGVDNPDEYYPLHLQPLKIISRNAPPMEFNEISVTDLIKHYPERMPEEAKSALVIGMPKLKQAFTDLEIPSCYTDQHLAGCQRLLLYSRLLVQEFINMKRIKEPPEEKFLGFERDIVSFINDPQEKITAALKQTYDYFMRPKTDENVQNYDQQPAPFIDISGGISDLYKFPPERQARLMRSLAILEQEEVSLNQRLINWETRQAQKVDPDE